MLAADQRLRTPRDFSNTWRRGRRARGRCVGVAVTPSSGRASRAGFIVGKNVGNAVVRHRVTRRLRAVLAEVLQRGGPAVDVVVRAYPEAGAVDFPTLHRDVRKALAQAGIDA